MYRIRLWFLLDCLIDILYTIKFIHLIWCIVMDQSCTISGGQFNFYNRFIFMISINLSGVSEEERI